MVFGLEIEKIVFLIQFINLYHVETLKEEYKGRIMESKLDEIEKIIPQLSTHERAQLARRLLESLDEEETELSEDQLNELWIEEANHRSQEIKDRAVKTRSAEDVLKDARERLR